MQSCIYIYINIKWSIKNNIGKLCQTPTDSHLKTNNINRKKKHDKTGCDRCLIYVKRSVSVIANKHIIHTQNTINNNNTFEQFWKNIEINN